MPWSDGLTSARMERVAIVAPRATLRATLVALAAGGRFEPDARHTAAADADAEAPREVASAGVADTAGEPAGAGETEPRAAAIRRRLDRRPADAPAPEPRLAADAPDLDALQATGRWDLLAGEHRLSTLADGAVLHGRAALLVGWAPLDALDALRADVARAGADVAPLARPSGAWAPTLVHPAGVARAFEPLVRTYATVPERDVDPALFAGIAYVVMFGMMFGDVAHGLILAGLGLALRWWRPRALRSFGSLWGLALGAGVVAAAFGLLYGEAFGPTGLVPRLWLSPLDAPLTLLAAALAVGAALMAITYVIGGVNRWREAGAGAALLSPTGIAGALMFVGVGGIAGGVLWWRPLAPAGVAAAAAGVVLTFGGLLAAAGLSGTGVLQAVVELFDSVLRIGSNTISFTRLAAFGMTHAAISQIVWEATSALWRPGPGMAAAVLVFVVGQVVAFSLELLVVAIQALRLEYYELFSRIFTGEGRPFAPFQMPVEAWKEPA